MKLWSSPAPRRARVSALFQACLGGIFLAVFLSLAVQLPTLIGKRGLLPITALDSVEHPGLSELWNFPTLLWLARSDAAIRVATWLGAAAALLLAAGLAPRVTTFAAWLLFLSCIIAGQDFFQYQWDNLLLESSFLALFLPARGGVLGLLHPERLREPRGAVVFLFRWLLFRVLFESALAKVQSGEGTWWNLSAMSYYYETAPLPSWGGWLVQQAPMWFHRASVIFTFLVEGVLCFLVFAPRRLRLVLFFANVAFQSAIFFTANYGYFNPLSFVVSLFLLEDRDLDWARLWAGKAAAWARNARGRVRELFHHRRGGITADSPTAAATLSAQRADMEPPGREERAPTPGPEPIEEAAAAGARVADLRRIARRGGLGLLVAFIVAASLVEAAFYFLPRALPASIPALREIDPLRFYAPLRIVNVYHLFPGVLRDRVVIEVNGTVDGATWTPYRFRYAPGDPKVAPPMTWLHNPRFAFHYSFLPLNRRRDLDYFNMLLRRLCCEPEAIADLIAVDPFPGQRPRALRVDFYRYRFGDLDYLRRTGEYWVREFLGSHRQIVPCRCPEAGGPPAPGKPAPGEPAAPPAAAPPPGEPLKPRGGPTPPR